MVSVSGSADTTYAIGGAIAELLFCIPPELGAQANTRLYKHILGIIERFRNQENVSEM